jgi:hypothetical protein
MIAKYEDLCELHMHLQIPNVSLQVEYSSYILLSSIVHDQIKTINLVKNVQIVELRQFY